MNSKLSHVQSWTKFAAQANWSASALAKRCGVSLRTLERQFFKEVGKSPKAWLTERRQHKATELLHDGNTVKITAACLGYKHASHFTNEFKKHWGHCPSHSTASSHEKIQ